MNIHEYQAKNILKEFGVPVPMGRAAFSSDEAQAIADELESTTVVVKAQIHAGGRGAGHFKGDKSGKGGVRVLSHKETVGNEAENMLGHTLITKQTGAEGKCVNRLYIEAGSTLDKEFYASILLDRSVGKFLIMASTEGGMDIEEVAESMPEKIIYRHVDLSGVSDQDAHYIVEGLGLKGALVAKGADFFKKLFTAYVQLDMELLEINPMVVTKEHNIVALDAKISFDDNALYRHPDIVALKDDTEEDPMELKASAFDLNYVKLQGTIGCIVNGAGLAMATMDIIKLKGESPANFLDVGGTATAERVTAAFEILLSDSNVKGILVNIFGGIVRCDIIAKGIIEAAKRVNLKVPLVVRLEGTNVNMGKEMLQNSGVDLISAGTLEDAADKIVECVRKRV